MFPIWPFKAIVCCLWWPLSVATLAKLALSSAGTEHPSVLHEASFRHPLGIISQATKQKALWHPPTHATARRWVTWLWCVDEGEAEGKGVAWQMATTLSSRVAFAAIDIEVAASCHLLCLLRFSCFLLLFPSSTSFFPSSPLLFVPLHLGSCSMLQLGKCQKGVDTSSSEWRSSAEGRGKQIWLA